MTSAEDRLIHFLIDEIRAARSDLSTMSGMHKEAERRVAAMTFELAEARRRVVALTDEIAELKEALTRAPV